jgi:hypothetical protein
MSKRFFAALTLALACALLLAACGSSETTTNGSNQTSANKTTTTTTTTSSPATTTTTTPSTTMTPATTTTPATTATGAGGDIGVPECDDFLTKYEACITGKIPEAARATFTSTLKKYRDQWRQTASTPEGRAGLAQGCKMAAEQTRAALKSFGCEL